MPARVGELAQAEKWLKDVRGEPDLAHRVEGGDEAVDDGEASIAEDGRMEPHCGRTTNLGNGLSHQSAAARCGHRPDSRTHDEILGLFENSTAAWADGHVVSRGEAEAPPVCDREGEKVRTRLWLGNREERDGVGGEGTFAGRGNDGVTFPEGRDGHARAIGHRDGGVRREARVVAVWVTVIADTLASTTEAGGVGLRILGAAVAGGTRLPVLANRATERRGPDVSAARMCPAAEVPYRDVIALRRAPEDDHAARTRTRACRDAKRPGGRRR